MIGLGAEEVYLVGRPPVIAPGKKIRVVLAVLAGEVSVSEAARKEKGPCSPELEEPSNPPEAQLGQSVESTGKARG